MHRPVPHVTAKSEAGGGAARVGDGAVGAGVKPPDGALGDEPLDAGGVTGCAEFDADADDVDPADAEGVDPTGPLTVAGDGVVVNTGGRGPGAQRWLWQLVCAAAATSARGAALRVATPARVVNSSPATTSRRRRPDRAAGRRRRMTDPPDWSMPSMIGEGSPSESASHNAVTGAAPNRGRPRE